MAADRKECEGRLSRLKRILCIISYNINDIHRNTM